MRTPAIALLLFGLVGCTDESDTVRTLEESGFTDIHTTGWNAWSCGHDDTFATGFTAKNAIGHPVSGTVCCGFLTKGCTVRF